MIVAAMIVGKEMSRSVVKLLTWQPAILSHDLSGSSISEGVVAKRTLIFVYLLRFFLIGT